MAPPGVDSTNTVGTNKKHELMLRKQPCSIYAKEGMQYARIPLGLSGSNS
jgi:hypothetical protein